MTDRISHTEAHEQWSEKQLVLFRGMGPHERLNAVKTGALKHWTEAPRAAALDLLGDDENPAATSHTPQTLCFEPAHHTLPPQAMKPTRIDLTLGAAGVGWAVIIVTTAVHASGFY